MKREKNTAVIEHCILKENEHLEGERGAGVKGMGFYVSKLRYMREKRNNERRFNSFIGTFKKAMHGNW